MTAERPVFGRDDPPAGTRQVVAAGWHPVCGHVRIYSVGPLDQADPAFSPGLVFGLIPRAEAVERLGTCATCERPPAVELGL